MVPDVLLSPIDDTIIDNSRAAAEEEKPRDTSDDVDDDERSCTVVSRPALAGQHCNTCGQH